MSLSLLGWLVRRSAVFLAPSGVASSALERAQPNRTSNGSLWRSIQVLRLSRNAAGNEPFAPPPSPTRTDHLRSKRAKPEVPDEDFPQAAACGCRCSFNARLHYDPAAHRQRVAACDDAQARRPGRDRNDTAANSCSSRSITSTPPACRAAASASRTTTFRASAVSRWTRSARRWSCWVCSRRVRWQQRRAAEAAAAATEGRVRCGSECSSCRCLPGCSSGRRPERSRS